ncbi:MAG: DoxX family membrane protein [Bacteroidota bacterium]
MNDKVNMGIRLLLGLFLVIMGVNKFANFMPPMEGPEAATNYFMALAGVGMMNVVGVLEIIIGLMLLVGKYVPLALVLLAPLSVNFLLFHILTGDYGNMLFAVVAAGLNIYLLLKNKDSYKGLLTA